MYVQLLLLLIHDLFSYIYRIHRKIIETARRKPELIELLNLHDEIKNTQNDFFLNEESNVQKLSQDQEIQTDIHPTPSNLDYNYSWNVWDLRRKAITLANARSCRTNSAQTDLNFHTFGVGTQTYDAKVHDNQTRVEIGTNVPYDLND